MADKFVEPGASGGSILMTTSTIENLDISDSTLKEIIHQSHSETLSVDVTSENSNNVDNLDITASDIAKIEHDDLEDDDEWAKNLKHIFVLSSAGKPIYCRYGNEDKLAWLFGVMQTLVSFVQSNEDTVKHIQTGNSLIVFLMRKPLILVAVSKKQESVVQLTAQLNYVFNQIASILTLTRLIKIFEQRQNYDLRRLLTGVERLIDHLLIFSEKEPAFLLGAIQCLPLAANIRSNISSAIIGACNKIKNLVFAILLADNKLITVVRMKKYCLHPADLHLIFNFVQASESLKTAESWTPLCLPCFDSSGFLYGHISYLSEDCQACLLLLTVERDVFFTLSEAKQRIVEKLRRNNYLEAINESLSSKDNSIGAGFPEVRHYLYKAKSTAQFYQPSINPPYDSEHLMQLYKKSHQTLHYPKRPLKLYFERHSNDAVFAWDTLGFELYVVFEPLIETNNVVATVSRLLNWMKEREDNLFHLHVPTF